MKKLLFFSFFSLALLMFGCSSTPSPRDVTMDFVGSVIEGDTLSLKQCFDVDAMVAYRMKVSPPADSTQTPEYYRNRIMKDITGEGGVRQYWKNSTPIVNNQLVKGDTAEVELTILDKQLGRTDYSKVYLYRSKNGWRVFNFQ